MLIVTIRKISKKKREVEFSYKNFNTKNMFNNYKNSSSLSVLKIIEITGYLYQVNKRVDFRQNYYLCIHSFFMFLLY